MADEKNKSVKSLMKTMELTPEMLEAIRGAKKSGKTFPHKKMEPDKPISEKDAEAFEKFIKPAPIKYKKGGAAFPDLTGDGKVTKKDILKGRGVKGFEEGGEVRGMGRAYMGASRKAKIR
jgi:hypothetical protein